MASIIYKALENYQQLKYPYDIKNLDYNDIKFKLITPENFIEQDCEIIQKSYSYKNNSYNDLLIKLSSSPLFLNIDKNFDLVAFSTFVELRNPKLKQGYFNSVDFYNTNTHKHVVKFVKTGRTFEYIADNLFQSNKTKTETIELTQNYKKLKLTERSFHEIVNNKEAENTDNSDIYFCYAILIENYKSINNYINNKDLKSIKSYIETNPKKYLSIKNALDTNYVIPNLDILLNIWLVSMPQEICFSSKTILLETNLKQVMTEKQKLQERLDLLTKNNQQLIDESIKNKESLDILIQRNKSLIKENQKLIEEKNILKSLSQKYEKQKTQSYRLIYKFIKSSKNYFYSKHNIFIVISKIFHSNHKGNK